MARGRFILILISFAGTICAAQDLRVVERTTWPLERYPQDAFGNRYNDFAPAPNPQLTNEYEAQAVEDLEPIDDQCTLYKAKLTQKELYFQYVRYKTDIPNLSEFTMCIWMRSENLSNDHTFFSYAVDGQPHEIRSWLSNTNRASYFNLAVGGTDGKGGEDSVHLFSINYPFRGRRWYHTCQSWSGITGNWLVYVEGERIGAGNSPATKGRVIRGGGVGVTGQTQHQTGGGFVERGGIEGEVTLFRLYPSAFPKPLHEADEEGRRFYRTSCDGLCKVGARPYTFSPTPTQPIILPPQARGSLILSHTTPLHVAEQTAALQQNAEHYYSVRENFDFIDLERPFQTYQPSNLGLLRQVVYQANPVDNGGVQLFSGNGGIRVARSLDRFLYAISPRADVDDSVYTNFEAKRLNEQSVYAQNLGYKYPQGLFNPAQGGLQYGGRYGLGADNGGNGGSLGNRELAAGETESVTVAYDGKDDVSVALPPPGYGRNLVPVIDWRTTPKKLYAGAMWLRANPVCRKF